MPAKVICLGGDSHGEYADFSGDDLLMPKKENTPKPDKDGSSQAERYRLIFYRSQYAGRRYAYLLCGDRPENYRHMYAFCTPEIAFEEDKNV